MDWYIFYNVVGIYIMMLWDYEMVFNSKLICILSGKVNLVTADDSENSTHSL